MNEEEKVEKNLENNEVKEPEVKSEEANNSEENEFEVIFLMDDNTTVLDRQFVLFGANVTYKGKTPEKEATTDGRFIFEGWTNEDKLNNVTSKVVCVAEFRYESNVSIENVMYQLTENVAENANLNDTLEAGKKVSAQQKALQKDPRSVEEIVTDIKENGKTEIGDQVQEQDLGNEK